LCHALTVCRTGYYQWLNTTHRKWAQENERLLKAIKIIYTNYKGRYGSPRITVELHEQGFCCSRPRVARIMAANGIVAKTKRKFKVTTNANHHYPISPNLLNQQFTAPMKNRIWISDITYIRTQAGWLYLTVIMDLYNRQIIGWSMSHRLTPATTTIPALLDAIQRQHPGAGVIFHSDRGVQYACHEFRKLLATYGMIQSMSGKGNCYDNAVCESFFSTLKTELVYFDKYETREQAKQSLFEYIEVFYNRQRKHSALNYKTPVQFTESKNNI
jgi:putative transposase